VPGRAIQAQRKAINLVLQVRSPRLLSMMPDLGKLLIILGAILIAAGLLLMLFGRLHLPLGRLPGDILYRGKHTTFYFPLATSILLSVVLSLIFYAIAKWRQ